MSDIQLSIVTGTVNRLGPLCRLVESIQRHTVVPFELIIMDASTHAVEIVDERLLMPVMRIVRESPRLGHVKGYNNAFRMCTGKYVLWLNDDAEVLPGYDTEGIRIMDLYPDVGMSAYYYKEGAHYHVNELYGMIFANFGIIRRELGDQVGWFDEDLIMYGSDNSLTFRVLLAGYGLATVPGPRIIHHSERDEMRQANEFLRRPDSDTLHKKYAPFKRVMQNTYLRTAHLVGPRILVGVM